MALSYDDQSNLMIDISFKGRVKIACLHYAQYITGEDPATPAHPTRGRWATTTFAQPDLVAQNILPAVVMESHVQADGKNVSDPDLQTDVETCINRVM